MDFELARNGPSSIMRSLLKRTWLQLEGPRSTKMNSQHYKFDVEKQHVLNIDVFIVRNSFRRSYGRKIFGVKYGGEIHAVMCFAYTNQIPKSVEELDALSQDAHLQSTLRGQNVGQNGSQNGDRNEGPNG